MKVLEKGRPQNGWSTKAKCTGVGNGGGGCGAKLLVEQSDLFRTSSSSYDGTTDHYCTFECTVCKVWTDLPDSHYPPHHIYSSLPRRTPGRSDDK